MGKREAAVEAADPAPNKGGKMKRVLAAIFYALALAVYIAVTVWRFALGEDVGWQYFPVVVFGILPASAFLTSGLMGYCKSFLFWLSPVVQVALLFLYELIAFRSYAFWPRIVLVAVASLAGVIVGLVLKMSRERAKSEKRRQKQKEANKAEQEKGVGEALKEFNEETKKESV